MAYQDRAPYIPQDPKQVQKLIQGLEAASGKSSKKGKGGFTCKKTTFQVGRTTVDSWKFNDWDYKRDDLPTYARGLFTYRTAEGSAEIATRGYDKFFNIEEVNDTKWASIEQSTSGPYELSVKENGCIIFISALDDLTLLICSKHSTGPRADADLSHAVAGERWVDKHLASVGKTRAELARELRRRNVTAVAELCDDAFEEHVLAYDEKVAGLYLHGLNVNIPEFATYSGSKVHEFADAWGFKKAQYLIKDDIESVKSFLEACAESGSYNGRDTEGFVIRCQRKAGKQYEDWFFKYKFEEPYLMYRQWREATKAIIAGRDPKFKKHQKITEEYLLFARRRFARNAALAKAYNMNHGIIQLREDFLMERGLKGSEIVRMEEEEETQGGDANKQVFQDVVLVPVATIGCGKTTLAVALTKLFGWGHVQNDNITGKTNRPKQFVKQLANLLTTTDPVVIADRNNHLRGERRQLLHDMSAANPSAKFVALHYVHHPKHEMLPRIREVTQARVMDRGDNHQTIRAGSKSQQEIIGIMEGFLSRFQPLDPSSEPDDNFDLIIDLDPLEDTRHNLELVVTRMHQTFPRLIPDPPNSVLMDAAVHDALNNYKPATQHDLSFNTKDKKAKVDERRRARSSEYANPTPPPKPTASKVEYFELRLTPQPISAALRRLFHHESVEPEMYRFYNLLCHSRAIQSHFHVTLIHRATMHQHPALWAEMERQYRAARASESDGFDEGGEGSGHAHHGSYDPVFGHCRVRLDRVVWDDRVMAIAVSLLDAPWTSANEVPHITVGCAAGFKPKESNNMLSRWKAFGPGGEGVDKIRELPFTEEIVLTGEARAVTPYTR